MQNVFLWSSETYECTQVTPSSALVPTTERHACAPLSVIGISSPSGKVRSTMNRAITTSCLQLGGPAVAIALRLGRGRHGAIREKTQARAQSRCSFSCSSLGDPRRDLDPRIEPELAEDVMHVVVDRSLGQVQALGDLLVAETAGQELSHLLLALAERCRDRRATGGRGHRPSGRKQAPRARYAGELAPAALGEIQAGPHDQVLHGA